MEYRKMVNKIVIRLDKDDEIHASIKEVMIKENVKLASVSGIGAVDMCEVGVFDTLKNTYDSTTFTGTHEIINLTGNINTMNGEYYAHLHITLAGKNSVVVGGHLLKGIISVTGEIFVDIIDGSMDREKDNEINVNKWKF